MKDDRIFIEIPSENRYIRKVSSDILSALSHYGVGESRLFDIKLCVEEAVRNAIMHGNRFDEKLRVKVSYLIADGRINIEVEDEGAGFDPAKIPNPTDKGNITKESGRGICLIRRLMDRVEFNKKGNKILMEKSLK